MKWQGNQKAQFCQNIINGSEMEESQDKIRICDCCMKLHYSSNAGFYIWIMLTLAKIFM